MIIHNLEVVIPSDMSSKREGKFSDSPYFIPDDSSDLRVSGVEEEKEVLVTYKGTRYLGVRIDLESYTEAGGDVNVVSLERFVEKLVDLCEISSFNLVGACNIIYSGTQCTEGIVPTMITFPLDSKSMKTLNETAFSLDQLTLAKTLSDIARILKMLHAKGYSHENINADYIYQDSDTKDYCLHTMHLVGCLVEVHFSSSTIVSTGHTSEPCGEKRDLFQFANVFRKMFLDYPSISTLLSCSITYILEDCLKPDPTQRPNSDRVSDALDGIMMGFNSMQVEIDRLVICQFYMLRLLNLTTLYYSLRLRKLATTITASREIFASALPEVVQAGTDSSTKHTGKAPIMRSIPVGVVHEKRSNTNAFDRALQLFKSKLQEVFLTLISSLKTYQLTSLPKIFFQPL